MYDVDLTTFLPCPYPQYAVYLVKNGDTGKPDIQLDHALGWCRGTHQPSGETTLVTMVREMEVANDDSRFCGLAATREDALEFYLGT